MEKEIQEIINTICEKEYENAMNEYCDIESNISSKKLRSCNATVFETDNYYILKSYATIVAIINKETDTLYDVLRLVYGYTATSAQHIAKFSQDYGKGKWGCAYRYMAR